VLAPDDEHPDDLTVRARIGDSPIPVFRASVMPELPSHRMRRSPIVVCGCSTTVR
jgi:hypothetical protein